MATHRRRKGKWLNKSQLCVLRDDEGGFKEKNNKIFSPFREETPSPSKLLPLPEFSFHPRDPIEEIRRVSRSDKREILSRSWQASAWSGPTTIWASQIPS